MSCFKLSQATITSHTVICRRFLWSGTDINRRTSLVSWESICHLIKEGGLGVKMLEVWNKAATLKNVWLIASGSGSLWANWVDANLIQNRSFWDIKCPKDFSWSWRHILNAREEAVKLMHYKIGKGNFTYFWKDPWHPLGVLSNRFPEEMRYDSILFKDAPVRNILNNGRWEVPENYAYILSDIWEGLNRVVIDVTGEDEVIWKASTSGTFTMKSSYEEIRHHNPTWNYAQLIWFNGCIPSHSFITWNIFKGALKTQTKLKRWGLVAQSVCLFCWAEEETENHIFFTCCYAKWIWEQLLQKLGFNRSTLNYNEEIQWVLSQIPGYSLKSILQKLCVNCFIYHIWRERNNRVFNNVQTKAPSLLKNILSDVKLKLACSKTKLLDTAVNRFYAESWELRVAWKVPVISHCKWKMPPNSVCMINCAGNTMGGFGAIIRIDEGRAVAACAGRMITKSMLHHELLSIKTGLKLAIKYGKVKNEVNTKSTMAVSVITKQYSSDWQCRAIVREILIITESLEWFRINQIPTEANQPVLVLSRLRHELGYEEVRPTEFSEELKQKVKDDTDGKTYVISHS
ncbi:hypothetical protein GIB67_022472 [Kingdonia uniflora]|uniref:Reverse transcriptase zinc-binding domain-containing protein n=1 Tax=Kingdonia uniflora TaxID=39325 RepID=A0A7J7MUB2_9MAGN|nr:hypothetical protein GIB67_022472 [Kingdonia uniflora]